MISTSIPRHFNKAIKEIWVLQIHLSKPQDPESIQLLKQKRFRAAYDLLLIREAGGEKLSGLGKWWTKFQFETLENQKTMIKVMKNYKKILKNND